MARYDVLRHGFYALPVELVERNDDGNVERYIFVDRSGNEAEINAPTSSHHHPDSDRLESVSIGTAAEPQAMGDRVIDSTNEPHWPFGFATIKDAVEATLRRGA